MAFRGVGFATSVNHFLARDVPGDRAFLAIRTGIKLNTFFAIGSLNSVPCSTGLADSFVACAVFAVVNGTSLTSGSIPVFSHKVPTKCAGAAEWTHGTRPSTAAVRTRFGFTFLFVRRQNVPTFTHVAERVRGARTAFSDAAGSTNDFRCTQTL